MLIAVELAFEEKAAVRLLNWLANENRIIFLERPDLPGLYESGVRYKREKVETWSDYLNLLMQGHEDCDALAAARAGELMARGYRALSLSRRDSGAAEARQLKLERIKAEVVLRTRAEKTKGGMYHCIVRYRIGRKWYYDDPSARLGMYGYVDMRQPKLATVDRPDAGGEDPVGGLVPVQVRPDAEFRRRGLIPVQLLPDFRVLNVVAR